MSVKRGNSSIVVLGAWNPAIITPAWLLQHKVFEVTSESPPIVLGQPGLPQIRIGKVTLVADFTKLIVQAEDGSDCGSFVARILGLLPHTPIAAIGTNFLFACAAEDLTPDRLPRLGNIQMTPHPSPADLKLIQTTWVRQMAEDAKLQISVTQQEGTDMVIGVNIHRDVTSASRATEVAATWADDRQASVAVLKEVFSVDIP